MSTQIKSMFVEPSENPASRAFMEQFADLSRVLDSSAVALLALLNKQLVNSGVSLPWSHLIPPLLGVPMQPTPLMSERLLRMFLFTSDGGADVVKYRKIMRAITLLLKFVFWIEGNCFFHAVQLVVAGGLKVVDRWAARPPSQFRLSNCSNAAVLVCSRTFLQNVSIVILSLSV
jgi:hypothetical protein